MKLVELKKCLTTTPHKQLYTNDKDFSKYLTFSDMSRSVLFYLPHSTHSTQRTLNNLSSLISPHTPVRSLRSSDMSLLTQPLAHLSIGRRAFSVCAPRLWNALRLCPCQFEVRLLFHHSNGPSKLITFKHWLHLDPLRFPGPQIRL